MCKGDKHTGLKIKHPDQKLEFWHYSAPLTLWNSSDTSGQTEGRQCGRVVRAEDFESDNPGSIPAQHLLHNNPEFHLVDVACK